MAGVTFKCGHSRLGRNAMPRGDGRGRGVCCRICKAAHNLRWRKAKPLEYFRAQKIRLRKSRIDPLLKKQENRCAICNRKMKYPYEDHNHHTGRKRGLLCPSCNGGLHLVENSRLLKAAIAYLKIYL